MRIGSAKISLMVVLKGATIGTLVSAGAIAALVGVQGLSLGPVGVLAALPAFLYGFVVAWPAWVIGLMTVGQLAGWFMDRLGLLRPAPATVAGAILATVPPAAWMTYVTLSNLRWGQPVSPVAGLGLLIFAFSGGLVGRYLQERLILEEC